MIAFGESIVAIGFGASGTLGDALSILALVVTFAGAAVGWWSYFDRCAPNVEDYFRQASAKEQGRFARDAYTFGHFPIVLGIVLYAVAAPEVVGHPGQALAPIHAWATAGGAVVFQLGIAFVLYRAFRRIEPWRVAMVLGLVLVPLVAGAWPSVWFVALLAIVIVAGLVWEARTDHHPRQGGAVTPL